MGVRLQWTGLEEFKQALRNLPEHLTTEAADIVVSAAQDAATQVQANYPVRTTGLHPSARRKSKWFPPGNLKARVKVTQQRDKASVSARVLSQAPHAILFEKGTRKRQTNRGANRGRMPAAGPGQAMIPTVIRARQQMVLKLIALLEREGLLVAK